MLQLFKENRVAALLFSSGFLAGSLAAIYFLRNSDDTQSNEESEEEDPERLMYIVRHGESMGNVNLSAYREYGDHRLPLTENGREMARQSGKFLSQELKQKFPDEQPWIEMWVSPFTRTRETAIAMLQGGLGKWVKKVSESPHLVEQDWGLLEGQNIGADEVYNRFPESMKRVRLQANQNGKFYARLPQGESVADVYSRVTNLLGSVSRRQAKYTIIVTHGITGRALIMRMFKHTPEWFESSVNLPNCSVYRITKASDPNGEYEWRGEFIFGGYGKGGIEDEVSISMLNEVNRTSNLNSLLAAVKYEQYLQEPGLPKVFDSVRCRSCTLLQSDSNRSMSAISEEQTT